MVLNGRVGGIYQLEKDHMLPKTKFITLGWVEGREPFHEYKTHQKARFESVQLSEQIGNDAICSV